MNPVQIATIIIYLLGIAVLIRTIFEVEVENRRRREARRQLEEQLVSLGKLAAKASENFPGRGIA
jgi:hypothetical protein